MPTTVEIFVESRPAGDGQPSEVEAFADLYNRTFSPLVAYCRRYCPPGYDPEDIAQEALSKAWSSWDRYSPARPFWPWVATIARRLCVDYWRRDERALARAGGSVALEPAVTPRPDELSEAADECRMAVTAFRRLRPDHQRIVGLRDIEGWSYEDIARFEGVTVESIRGSLRRARMSLRKSYESLAKGGVAAVLPLGGLVRAWQAARGRMALRMARWQTTLNDTGVATTRLGEALVSLMAISVAAVGMGAPGADVVVAGDGNLGSIVSSGSDAAGIPAAAAGAAQSGTSSSGSTGAGNITAPADWATVGDAWQPPVGLLGRGDGGSASDASFESFAPSPNYAHDGVVFGVGRWASGCTVDCQVVFKSEDRGVSWRPLRSRGFTSTQLLLPPAYPRDSRIFATGSQFGLQVSHDGGTTFSLAAPSAGPAIMSPAFNSGDPRIVLPEAPGWQYDAERNIHEPLGLTPSSMTTSTSFTYAFPTDYAGPGSVMYVGSLRPQPPFASVGVVHRCVNSVCDEGQVLEGSGLPTLSVHRINGQDVVFAEGSAGLFRSLDGGGSFIKLSFPAVITSVRSPVVTASGRVLVLAVENGKSTVWYSDDLGGTWSPLAVAGVPNDALISSIKPLPDGRLLLGLGGRQAGVACSHDDGRTWQPHC